MRAPVAPERVAARHADPEVPGIQLVEDAEDLGVHRAEELRIGVDAVRIDAIGTAAAADPRACLEDRGVYPLPLQPVRGRQARRPSSNHCHAPTPIHVCSSVALSVRRSPPSAVPQRAGPDGRGVYGDAHALPQASYECTLRAERR
jgi:hypothetical protein